MCDFISWVEVEKGEKTEIFFLTDEKVFSYAGRKLLEGCRDNDFIGHGAIRKFFSLGNEGIDREERDFWDTDKLPEPLKSLLSEPESFMNVWGKMFKRCFFNDDLRDIIYNVPEPYKRMAWDQLMEQNPSNNDLRYIIYNVPEPYKRMAWDQLTKQSLSNNDLHYIIYNAPEPYKRMARRIYNEK